MSVVIIEGGGEVSTPFLKATSVALSTARFKRCGKCGCTKPATRQFFYARKKHRDGLDGRCKSCVLSSQKVYRAKNIEACRERCRAYASANKDAARDRFRKWESENKEANRAKSRDWNRRNPDKVSEGWRKWIERNPERAKELHVRSSQCYRARKRGAPGNGATLSELVLIHGPLCHLCKEATADTVDHVIPLSRGGSNYLENLKPACKSCNSRKGNRMERGEDRL